MAIPGLEACANRFDDTLRFMRVAHSDRLSARLLRGIVVSTGKSASPTKIMSAMAMPSVSWSFFTP